MAVTTRAEMSLHRRFARWAVGPWVLLLLACFASVEYWLQDNYLYLAVAVVVVVVSGACLLRQPWARASLRVLAVLLAVWAFVSGALMLSQWHDFDTARQQALAQVPTSQAAALWLIERAQRSWVVTFACKAVAIPLLFWLEHQLGRPAVRLQFRRPH